MTDDLVKRLDNLWAMLEEEGYYVKANTVTLAKDRIEQLERERDEARAGNHAVNEHEPTWAELTDCWRTRAHAAEALLAKAVEVMTLAVKTWQQPHYGEMDTALDHGDDAMDLIRTVLAEI